MKMKNLVALTSAVVLTLTLAPTAFAADRTHDMIVGNEQTIPDANGNSVTTKDYSGAIEPGDSFSADTVIKATVNVPTAKVISVTLPSTMSMAIGTKFNPTSLAVVYDAATTHTVDALIKNSSKGCNVNIDVEKVTTTSDALSTLKLNLAAVSPNADPVLEGGVNLLTTTVNENLLTHLTGLSADGTGAAGVATLTLSTGMVDGVTQLDALAGKSITVTPTLKVVAATP